MAINIVSNVRNVLAFSWDPLETSEVIIPKTNEEIDQEAGTKTVQRIDFSSGNLFKISSRIFQLALAGFFALAALNLFVVVPWISAPVYLTIGLMALSGKIALVTGGLHWFMHVREKSSS